MPPKRAPAKASASTETKTRRATKRHSEAPVPPDSKRRKEKEREDESDVSVDEASDRSIRAARRRTIAPVATSATRTRRAAAREVEEPSEDVSSVDLDHDVGQEEPPPASRLKRKRAPSRKTSQRAKKEDSDEDEDIVPMMSPKHENVFQKARRKSDHYDKDAQPAPRSTIIIGDAADESSAFEDESSVQSSDDEDRDIASKPKKQKVVEHDVSAPSSSSSQPQPQPQSQLRAKKAFIGASTQKKLDQRKAKFLPQYRSPDGQLPQFVEPSADILSPPIKTDPKPINFGSPSSSARISPPKSPVRPLASGSLASSPFAAQTSTSLMQNSSSNDNKSISPSRQANSKVDTFALPAAPVPRNDFLSNIDPVKPKFSFDATWAAPIIPQPALHRRQVPPPSTDTSFIKSSLPIGNPELLAAWEGQHHTPYRQPNPQPSTVSLGSRHTQIPAKNAAAAPISQSARALPVAPFARSAPAQSVPAPIFHLPTRAAEPWWQRRTFHWIIVILMAILGVLFLYRSAEVLTQAELEKILEQESQFVRDSIYEELRIVRGAYECQETLDIGIDVREIHKRVTALIRDHEYMLLNGSIIRDFEDDVRFEEVQSRGDTMLTIANTEDALKPLTCTIRELVAENIWYITGTIVLVLGVAILFYKRHQAKLFQEKVNGLLAIIRAKLQKQVLLSPKSGGVRYLCVDHLKDELVPGKDRTSLQLWTAVCREIGQDTRIRCAPRAVRGPQLDCWEWLPDLQHDLEDM